MKSEIKKNRNTALKKYNHPNPKGLIKTPIKHIIIVFKENHGFDNYFGTFPGANGVTNLPHLPDPPLNDPQHTHEAWLKRSINAIKGQYHESDIPNYFSWQANNLLCVIIIIPM